jgi:hypothetical protein
MRHPPKVRLAHTGGDYVTIVDAHGNQLPVVRIENAWVPLTEASLAESRKQSPSPNFGIAPRYPSIRRQAAVAVLPTTQQTSTRATTTTHAAKPAHEMKPAEVVPMDEQKPAAVDRTTINDDDATTILQRIVEAFGATPMDVVDDEATTEVSEDATMNEELEDEEEASTIGGSIDSLESNASFGSASTMGQSVVTWAQVASHHRFDPSLGASETIIHSYSEEVELQFPMRRELTKLEVKRGKNRRVTSQMSSLQAAALKGAEEQEKEATRPTRMPIRSPQRDDQGRLLLGSEEIPDDQPDKASGSELVTFVPQSRHVVRVLRKRMLKKKEDNAYLTEMVHQLNSAVAQLMNNQQQMMISQGNQTQLIVPHQPQAILRELPHFEQVSSQIVEWSPSRPRRRSKKTVLQSTERLPPREPAGTPQVTKKKRVSASETCLS